MPVHFKTKTEYTSKYKTMPMEVGSKASGQPSPLLALSEPSIQAKKRVQPPFMKTSPVKSQNQEHSMQSKKRVVLHAEDEKTVQCEPPLQSKKRSQGPAATLSYGFFGQGHAQDDFALLGNQDKFSENVKYRVRSSQGNRDSSPPKQMKLQKKQKENQSPPRHTAPAPVVDTEQFRAPPTPLAPRKPKDQSPDLVQEIKKSNVAKQPKVVHSPKQSVSEPRKSQAKAEEEKNLDRQDPVKDSMKSKKLQNMNAFAQTNVEKGVMDSAPEAPADYALRYKTGVSAPRPSKKLSEYQKQFAWKAGMPASPLLKAEQVVYNSNPQLVPPKKDVIPKVSEYQKQFKAYKLVPVPEKEAVPVQKKILKMQKSKSMEDLSPADIPTAGSSPVISPGNKRLTLETDQKMPVPVPQVPVKKSRNVRSEYRSNYKPPNRFDYLRGSWHGASPPQLHLQVSEDDIKTPSASNWFAEVLELRKKAKEYGMRAQGTHFSREHLVQLMAKQNDLWEASTTTARSSGSALTLESGRDIFKDDEQQDVREDKSIAATMATEDDHRSESLSVAEDLPPQRKLAWTGDDDDESPETPSEPSDAALSGEGRKTTPKLREQLMQNGNARRHHLDRTTPSVGGALLSYPPQVRKKKTGKKMVTSKSVDSISIGTAGDESPEPAYSPIVHKPLAGQKTYSVNKANTSTAQTYGMPSRDSHFLRDDSQLVDSELRTQFVYTPAKARGTTPGGLGVIDEGFGQTYNKSKPEQHDMSWTIDGGLPVARVDEDDALSVSMQSIASSCSVASATLDRARKRKEEFWGKNGIATR